ncbi:hypothetical protein MNBD_DELTA01-1023 [hydrothermal vent metagenome]|uniref:DUF559 domain-containing protein n=1 Tax=hydrothermal vent metagenome TaxID=652676 RepID=A0A3B0QVF7_9ZZZZ
MAKIPYNSRLQGLARANRKNMTDAESLVWYRIRRKQLKGLQFYRQKIIADFIVDFYCSKAKLVIEIDGAQHYSEKGLEKDRLRDEYISSLGLKVLRFSDTSVLKEIEGVIESIYNNL